MSTEIQLYSRFQNPLEAIDKLGEYIAKSGFFGCDNVNAGKTIALICISENMKVMDFFRTYDLVLSKPRKKALAVQAEFLAKGGKITWIKDGTDRKEAKANFLFDGQTITSTFTIEDAQRAGLVKKDSNWEKWTPNMLRARVITGGVMILCPDIVAGPTEGQDVIDVQSSVESVSTLKQEMEKTATVTPAPANIINVEIVPQIKKKHQEDNSNPELQPSDPNPTVHSSAVTQAIAAAKDDTFKASKGADNKLSDETVKKLQSAIGESNMLAALKWLVAKKWLKGEDPVMFDLRVDRAQQILDNPNGFVQMISKV